MLIFPKYLDLELTSACPADCLMCPREHLPKSGLMSENVFRAVLKNLEEYGRILTVGLCGIGEPLLHPDIFSYIRRLKSLAEPPKVSLVTAGERLTPEIFEKLKAEKIDFIEFSIQAVEENLYQTLMPGLNFRKVLDNLEYIAFKQNSTTKVSLSFTIHKLNIAHLPQVVAFAHQRNFPLNIQKIHTRGGNVLKPELLDLPADNSSSSGCRIFELINFIAWNGDFHLCCQDARRVHRLGNVLSESFQQITEKKNVIIGENGLKYDICLKCDDRFRNLLN